MADLAAHIANLNPFSRRKKEADEEDKGADLVVDAPKQHERRVSDALQSFLARHGVHVENRDALDALVAEPVAEIPSSLLNRSHPLPHYFVSSSHNTYLLAHQLFGTSCASGYEAALRTGSRCVEIDAWDNDDDPAEPKVTHGFTLVSHIPFRAVCETIRDFWDAEAATSWEPGHAASPILLSLENHCKPAGQLRLVQIMKDIFGDRLLSEEIRKEGHREQAGTGEHVALHELGGKIAVIVEYHIPGAADSSDSSSDDSTDDEEERQARKQYKGRREEAAGVIIPELAALGVYAQSIKPGDTSWFEAELVNGPHHHLINISESGLDKHLPQSSAIARHNAQHLMRVFPKGLRISSSNLKPVRYWGVGAQICALNWQTFGASNQLNQALFAGSDGYVLKPEALRGGAAKKGRKRLTVHVAGASSVPLPHREDGGDAELRPYFTCTLYHPADRGEPAKRKTAPYKSHHTLEFLHREASPPTDPMWDQTLEWEFEDDELVFLRLLVKNDTSWARNQTLGVAAVRLLYVRAGWRFVRMKDLHGVETGCTVLVKFQVTDV